MGGGVINYNTANTILTVGDVRRFVTSCGDRYLDDDCIVLVEVQRDSWWRRLFDSRKRITHIKAFSSVMLEPLVPEE